MGVMEGLRAPKMLTERLRPPEARSERCLNCGAAMVGPFCAQCGQRDIPPYPSVRELVTDAFWELSGWDGRFAASVRALVRAPGQLTLDFLEGRRARYISPLRLYLLASLLYFLVSAAAPQVSSREGIIVSGSLADVRTNGQTGGKAARRVGEAAQAAREGTITAQQRDSALAAMKNAPAILQPILHRAVSDPKGFQRSLIQTMPRVLFGLVPVFAAIMTLFYRRRRYPEHLYFGLHLHAFFFVALTLTAAAKFTRSYRFAGIVGALVSAWIIGYSVVAARRVYHERTARTIVKGVGVTTLYAIAGLAGFAVAIYVAAFT
jgi:hypothetical protein